MGSNVERILVMDVPTEYANVVFTAMVNNLKAVGTIKETPSFFAYPFPIPNEMCAFMKHEKGW